MSDPTDLPAEWAGVVLRYPNGNFVAYELANPDVHLRVSSEVMTQAEMVDALREGNMGRLTRSQRVDIQLRGKTSTWETGADAARSYWREEVFKALPPHLGRRPLDPAPQPPVT